MTREYPFEGHPYLILRAILGPEMARPILETIRELARPRGTHVPNDRFYMQPQVPGHNRQLKRCKRFVWRDRRQNSKPHQRPCEAIWFNHRLPAVPNEERHQSQPGAEGPHLNTRTSPIRGL